MPGHARGSLSYEVAYETVCGVANSGGKLTDPHICQSFLPTGPRDQKQSFWLLTRDGSQLDLMNQSVSDEAHVNSGLTSGAVTPVYKPLFRVRVLLRDARCSNLGA